MSEPYETRISTLGPFTLKAELTDDEESSVIDWLCDFEDTPSGISYDRKQDVLIDADEQVYFEDEEQKLIDAWEEEREPRILAAQAVRDAAWEKLDYKQRRAVETQSAWFSDYIDDALRAFMAAVKAEEAIWKEPEPELPDSFREKYNDEGYLILPWPKDLRQPAAPMDRHTYRYITLEHHTLGLKAWRSRETEEQARNPEYESYTDEQEITWAAQDASHAIGYLCDEWHYVYVQCSITLDGEDDEPGEGRLLGEGSVGGVESGDEEYMDETIKDVMREAWHQAHAVVQDTLEVASAPGMTEFIVPEDDFCHLLEAVWTDLEWDISYP